MKDENLIVKVNGPVIEGHTLQTPTSGVIYSISLSNGIVVTSPEGFAAVTHVIAQKYRKQGKQPDYPIYP